MEPKDGAEEAIVVAEESQPAPKKATIAARIEGRSLFPVSRMQKIIKADKAGVAYTTTILAISD